MVKPAPTPTDAEIGVRIRARRRALEVTQKTLAAALGVTFQQVQKYENGRNRLSASMLVKAAAALQTTVGTLVGERGAVAVEVILKAFLEPPEATRLLATYLRIEDAEARQLLVGIAGKLAREADRRAWERLEE